MKVVSCLWTVLRHPQKVSHSEQHLRESKVSVRTFDPIKIQSPFAKAIVMKGIRRIKTVVQQGDDQAKGCAGNNLEMHHGRRETNRLFQNIYFVKRAMGRL